MVTNDYAGTGNITSRSGTSTNVVYIGGYYEHEKPVKQEIKKGKKNKKFWHNFSKLRMDGRF